MTAQKRILLVRTDRIGDVVLTTPALALLRRKYPAAHIALLVRPYTAGAVRNNPDLNEVIEFDGVLKTARLLREKKFHAAVLFFVDRPSALTVFLARIPRRIGPASKIWSLLLTRPVFQNRSRGKRHEADYNTALLAPLGVEFQKIPPVIFCPPPQRIWAEQYLTSEFGIAPASDTVFLHPGSRGSARDWPLQNFAELALLLRKARPDLHILFTGSGAELAALARNIKPEPGIHLMRHDLPLEKYCALVSKAAVMAANSTGPLHLAVALGVPVVAFFPPLAGCLPVRWGPYGGKSDTLMPDRKEWDEFCAREGSDQNAMRLIAPVHALPAVLQQLEGAGKR
ncbi:MAG: glycosyltransferase family 9 protein [Elusimicrobiaceae bacterium]|nr:glycosyltransferase family 9 protein [Elusimicrobiaceae bacterium]